jgi:hypothetical protein
LRDDVAPTARQASTTSRSLMDLSTHPLTTCLTPDFRESHPGSPLRSLLRHRGDGGAGVPRLEGGSGPADTRMAEPSLEA